MKTNVNQMKCGGCGCGNFKIFSKEETAEILVECNGCKSVNSIKPKAQLQLTWEGEGGLCFMD